MHSETRAAIPPRHTHAKENPRQRTRLYECAFYESSKPFITATTLASAPLISSVLELSACRTLSRVSLGECWSIHFENCPGVTLVRSWGILTCMGSLENMCSSTVAAGRLPTAAAPTSAEFSRNRSDRKPLRSACGSLSRSGGKMLSLRICSSSDMSCARNSFCW